MPLDVFQQVFTLSQAASGVNNAKGGQEKLQQQLQSKLNFTLSHLGPEWKLVWGPVVWKHFPDLSLGGPDNSWYIAYHPNLQYEDGSVHPTYVIAIAGTPGKSLYVWALENFTVSTVTDFHAWVAGGIQSYPLPALGVLGSAYIATGTVTTIRLLLTTAAPGNAVSPGTTLLDFIKNIDQSASPRFISTGHSLGGALSPSIALALVKSGLIPADKTLTYPTAGPSPGDVAFAELFAQTFPARKAPGSASYQGWNLNLVNTLDPVPQAWALSSVISLKQNLLKIPGLYGESILPDVRLTVWLGVLWSASLGTRYKPIPSQYFTGTAPSSVPTNLLQFAKIIHPEHVNAYFTEVGVPIRPPGESQALLPGLTLKTAEENLYNFPLINDLEWALDHPEEAKEVQEKVQAAVDAKGGLSGLVGAGASAGVSAVGTAGASVEATASAGVSALGTASGLGKLF